MGITTSAVDASPSTDQATNGSGESEHVLGDDIVTALLPSRAPARDEGHKAGERDVWEYRTELLERGFLGWRSEQLDLRTLQARLDELGEDGWELVHASWNHRVRGRHGGHVLLFKRLRS